MMTRACPNCGTLAEAQARYCRACYTVFPTDSSGGTGHARRRGSGTGSGAWKFALLLLAGLGGAWFYSIDTEDWSAQPGSFEAAAIDTKRQLVGFAARARASARRALGGPAAKRPQVRDVAAADVRRSAAGCTIAQRVSNGHAETVSPIVLSFTFRAADASAVGAPVNSVVNTPLPPGASRELRFELPCPDLFASVQVRSPDERITLSEPAGRTPGWLLAMDPRLACVREEACEIVIRFRSGDMASYTAERLPDERIRLIAADQRGIALLSRSSRAALLVAGPDRETRSIPIVREADDRWTVDGGTETAAPSHDAP